MNISLYLMLWYTAHSFTQELKGDVPALEKDCTCFPPRSWAALLSCFCWVCVSWLPITTTGPVSRTQPAACKNANKLYRTLHLHLCSWQMMSQSDLQDDVKKIPAIFICLFWVCLFVCAAGSGRVPYWGWRGAWGWLLQDEVPLGPFLGPPAFLESVHNLPAAGQTYS